MSRIIVSIDPNDTTLMTIQRDNKIQTSTLLIDTPTAQLLTATDVGKDFFLNGAKTSDMQVPFEMFVKQSFGIAVDASKAQNVKSTLGEVATIIDPQTASPIKIIIASKTSLNGGLLGTQVINGYAEQFYDSGNRKVFIGKQPDTVGTLGTLIDTGKKIETNKLWPPTDTTVEFTQDYCTRVGLPLGFKMETTTINSDIANANAGASVTFNYNFEGATHSSNETFSVTGNPNPSSNPFSQYLVGNKKKNRFILQASKSNLEKYSYFLFKELGDFTQVLLYHIASRCNAQDQDAITNLIKRLFILITTDYVVYLRLRAFLEHVLYTGVRAGVKSGEAIFLHNCPEPLSFLVIIERLQIYNTSLYYDILHHNIANLNYLCKIRFGLHKLKINGKDESEKKANNKQARRILHFFSLFIPNKGRTTTALYKKIYLSRFASGCKYINEDVTHNDDILETIIGNINIIISRIIDQITDLIILKKYYSELLENCSSGTNNLPCLYPTTIIEVRDDLKTQLSKIFTERTLIDTNDFEKFLTKTEEAMKAEQAMKTIETEIDDLFTSPKVTQSTGTTIPIAETLKANCISIVSGAFPTADLPMPPSVDLPMAPSADLPMAPSADLPMAPSADLPMPPSVDLPMPPVPGPGDGPEVKLDEQITGINDLIINIASLKAYESSAIISIIAKDRFHIIDPRFLIIEGRDYTIGARGQDIIDDEVVTVYKMLEKQLVSENQQSTKGGMGSRVTKKHLKSHTQGKDNNIKNDTKKRRKMIKSRNKVITGGVKRPVPVPVPASGLEPSRQKSRDTRPDYITKMDTEEEDEDVNNVLNINRQEYVSQLSKYRMNKDDVEMSDMSQEDFIWYVATQIVKKFDTDDTMTRLVYDSIVKQDVLIEDLLNAFHIPYDEEVDAIAKADIFDGVTDIMTICHTLPEEMPGSHEAEPGMFEADAESLSEADAELLSEAEAELLSEAEATSGDGSQSQENPVLVTPIRSGSVGSNTSSVLSSARTASSMNVDGGYSGINKKRNKSRKNKKTRRKTRRNTRRKTKKIRTRKNKQVRRKQ